MPKRTDILKMARPLLLAVLTLWGGGLLAQDTGQFCAYLLNDRGEFRYVDGEVYLESNNHEESSIPLTQYGFGTLRATDVEAGDYELVVSSSARPTERVPLHFAPESGDTCNPQLVVREHSGELVPEWHDTRTGWVDPATERWHTVNRLCGHVGRTSSASPGSYDFKGIRAAIVDIYKRAPNSLCCTGEPVGHKVTGRSGWFSFDRLPDGPYWLRATFDDMASTVPVRVSRSEGIMNQDCPWFYKSSDGKLVILTTITVD